MLFSLNNLLRTGSSGIYFDTSKISYQIDSNTFGPGYFLNYGEAPGNEQEIKYLSTNGGESSGFGSGSYPGFNLLLSNPNKTSEECNTSPLNSSYTDFASDYVYYASKKIDDDNDTEFINGIHSVPFLISTPNNIEYRYYNSSKDAGMMPES
jgi:hypothetical protein